MPSFTLLHTESSTGWGGQEHRTIKESIGLKKLGNRVIIACPPNSRIAEAGAEHGIEIRTMTMQSSISLAAISSLLKIIKSDRVDIICTHSGKDSMLGALAGRISGRKPVIIRTRHLALPITSRITYSMFPHRVVAVSEFVRKYLVEEKRIAPHKVVVIPTGVDLARFNPDAVKAIPREQLGIESDTVVIGTVAILRRKKGHHTLLDAIPAVLKEFPKTVFMIAGDGPQKENIENRIAELKIEKNTRLLGLRRDIPEILKCIDLFVLPTLQEALGTSFLEAMAMRKAVIGTRVGGVPEVIAEGVSGLLVEPENPLALADAIISLLKDRDRMATMGSRGREIVEEKYGIETMIENLHRFYKQTIN